MTESTSRRSRHLLIGFLAGIIAVCLVGAVVALWTTGDRPSATGSHPEATADQIPEPDMAAPKQPAEALQIIRGAARNDPDDPRAKGDIDAPVLMIEMSDYSCPLCSVYATQIAPQLEHLVEDGTLRIEFHDYAIFDEQYSSTIGAAGGIAAGKQGKFWEYHQAAEELSASDHPRWTPELIRGLAQKIGVPDLEAFERDAADEQTLAGIRARRDEIASWGVQGTPAFFVNDRFISGAQDVKVFLATIEAAKADGRQS